MQRSPSIPKSLSSKTSSVRLEIGPILGINALIPYAPIELRDTLN